MKYYERWAWGDTSNHPKYKVFWIDEAAIDAEEEVRWFFEDIYGEQFNYSDKFRGITWDLIDLPPEEYLLKEVKHKTNLMAQTKIELAHLNREVASMLKEGEE